MEPKLAPYGTWSSPILSASAVACVHRSWFYLVPDKHESHSQTVMISYVFVNPITDRVYHVEQCPAECGQSMIVHSRSSTALFEWDLPWDARSVVHEYGGRATAAYDDMLDFSNHPRSVMANLTSSPSQWTTTSMSVLSHLAPSLHRVSLLYSPNLGTDLNVFLRQTSANILRLLPLILPSNIS